MMRTLEKSKSPLRAVGKAKPFAVHSAKSDARLNDANKFLLPTYKRPPMVLTHGRGCLVFDATGKKYLDFLGGIAVNAVGHAHPRIVKVIRREAPRAIHLSNLYHNAYQGPLARKLAEWSGLDRVFFSNSGTEAIEGALKLARLHGRVVGETATAAPSAPLASPPRKNIACPSVPSCQASNLYASMMSPTCNRNSTTPSAQCCSKPFKAKAAFISQRKPFGIARAPWPQNTARS
jgi:hypothetical protein